MDTVFLQSGLNLKGIKIAGEPVINIIWCVAIILFALLLKRSIAKLLTRLLCKLSTRFGDRKHGEELRILLLKPLEYLLATALFYVALNQLNVLLDTTIFRRFNETGRVRYAVHFVDAIDQVFLLFIILFSSWVASRLIDFIFHTLISKAFEEDNKDKEQLFPLVKEVVKILVWTTGLFWILGSVFNVNIPALVTGLGIGGVAIALAAKESVENLFAAFTILTDKPFRSGDNIRLDKFEGKVERVGFRSTRLRSVDGSLFIIPNKKLIGDNLENLTERAARRVKVLVNIKYGVSYTQLEEMITFIKSKLESVDYLINKKEVLLEAFNEASFVLNIIYYLPDPLPEHLQLNTIKHEINMKIFETVSEYMPTEDLDSSISEEDDDEPSKKEDEEPTII